jgi:hypothetical protein
MPASKEEKLMLRFRASHDHSTPWCLRWFDHRARAFFFSLLLGLFAVLPARADVQYTIPQTVQQTLANTVACTGSLQSYAVNNLGQTQHSATITFSVLPTTSQVTINATDTLSQSMVISDFLMGSPVVQTQTVNASGYYPKIFVVVNCTGGTYNLAYSGTSSTPPVNSGTSLYSQVQKTLMNASSAGSTLGVTFSPPFGSSLGQIVTQASGTGFPVGSTITINCRDLLLNTVVSTVFTPTATGQQLFPVAANSCPSLNVVYTAGGASANTYTLEYLFPPPGVNQSADPCGPGNTKSSAVITAPAATTTQIVAGVAGQQIYACGYNLGVVVAVAGTVQWTSGTGGTCAANTVTKTGAIPINTAEPFSYGPGSTLFTAAPGSGVCLTLTGAGDNAAGIFTYVQQ